MRGFFLVWLFAGAIVLSGCTQQGISSTSSKFPKQDIECRASLTYFEVVSSQFSDGVFKIVLKNISEAELTDISLKVAEQDADNLFLAPKSIDVIEQGGEFYVEGGYEPGIWDTRWINVSLKDLFGYSKETAITCQGFCDNLPGICGIEVN